MGYSSGMQIEFTDSARKHFAEDRLDETMVKTAIAHPLWFAIVDPKDPTIPPPARTQPPVALIISKRHTGALTNDLIEILVKSLGRKMVVYHVMHLSGIWREYWQLHR
jgi:hypothetical protein